ncbi:MAG: lysine-2,3-aminomutase-like protein [Rhizomicrobium sp.]
MTREIGSEAGEAASDPAPRKGGVYTARQLVDRGLVGSGDLADIERVCGEFSLAITKEMVELIDSDGAADPIAAQFVPDPRELTTLASELHDPIGDDRFTPVKGVTHRYPDRVLLKPVHICPVYCRFCFRREKVGAGGDGNLSAAELDAALDYIRRNENIWEVILTGGDPLILSPRKIGTIIRALDAIEHVKIIRIHTRVPVVDPTHIDEDMVAALSVETALYVVLHANHVREMTQQSKAAIARLVFAGIPMLSQSVLLRGVNDNTEALRALFKCFLENRVKPYYLHHGDLARGTSHFRTTIEEGQRILRALRGSSSGLCQPHYVLDIPGGAGKVPIGPNYLAQSPDGTIVEDDRGRPHKYADK